MSFSSHNDLLVCFEVYCASHSFEIGSQQCHENFCKCAAATREFNEEVLKIMFALLTILFHWCLYWHLFNIFIASWICYFVYLKKKKRFIICLVLGQYQACWVMGLNKKCLLLWRVKDMRMLLRNIRKSVCPSTLEQGTGPTNAYVKRRCDVIYIFVFSKRWYILGDTRWQYLRCQPQPLLAEEEKGRRRKSNILWLKLK